MVVTAGKFSALLIPLSVPTVVVSSRRMQPPRRPWTGRDCGETVSNLESQSIGWRSWRPASGGLPASCLRAAVRPSGKSRPSPIPRLQPSPRFCNISPRTPPAAELEHGQKMFGPRGRCTQQTISRQLSVAGRTSPITAATHPQACKRSTNSDSRDFSTAISNPPEVCAS